MLHLGIDIGDAKMEAALLDPAGKCVQCLCRPTHKRGYDAFMRQLLTLIADIRAVSPQPFTLGVGLPGAIDPRSGRTKNYSCLVLNGHDLRQDIMQQLGQPVWMANDADCFTPSEAANDAGAGASTVFGVIIGTGCGGGVVVHQQLLSGPNAIARKWGYNPLPGYTLKRDGPPQPYYCGKASYIEGFLSGTGFARRYGEQAHAEAIVAAVQNGDPYTLAHQRHFIDAFARSLASAISILDPQVIMLGGGLSNVNQIYRDLPAAIVPWIFFDTCRTQIRPARFGGASDVRGATWLPRLPDAADEQRQTLFSTSMLSQARMFRREKPCQRLMMFQD